MASMFAHKPTRSITTQTQFSLEFKFGYFANGKFTKFELSLS